MPNELTIGEVAARSGVAASALRFYERRGLIAAARTDGNQRRYDRSVLRRIAFVQAGRAAGITLTEIGSALEGLPTHRTPSRRDWERLSKRWRDDLDARIETLHALRDLPVNRPVRPAEPRRRGSCRGAGRALPHDRQRPRLIFGSA